MADLINSGNKKDKWTKRVTDLLNWLNEKKQATLVAGENVTLTPQQDGTVEISAGGGAVALDDLTDVDVSSVADGQALVYDETNEKWIAGEAGQVDDVKVNGTSVVSNKIAEITSYKEVTQAEYNALPSSKNSDGVAYFVKNSGITVNNRFSPVIYSNDEREIGVWTDGKPLYQKTIHISALPSTIIQEISYPHGIANIDAICDYFGVVRWSNGGVASLGARIYLTTVNNAPQISPNSSWQIQCNKTNIVVAVGSDRSALNADVTIQYTKTTDTAGSGTWGTDGTPMHHYSTSERIVGTFTDGKTIYEKTYHLTAPTTLNYNIPLQDVSGLNIDKVISLDGYYYGNSRSNINFYLGESNASSCWVNADYEIAMRITNNARVGQAFFVTLRYTKTT